MGLGIRHPTQEPPLASASGAAGRRPTNTARLVALAARDRLMKFASRPVKGRDETELDRIGLEFGVSRWSHAAST